MLITRTDLTHGRAYSLSAVSREVVSTLSEPLTVNVFFTRNLPAPYNGVEQYLRDLLEEYTIYGGSHFNYRFYDVSADEGDVSADAKANQKLASTYGINPIQNQAIEKDEIKFQRAYMGLVMIHGDLIEQIPTITTLDGLEYRITTAIQKMNHKISALFRLPDNILVRLFLSSSLNAVAPYIGIKQLGSVPVEIERLVKDLYVKTYGKLAYEFVDPASAPDFESLSRTYNLLALSWPASADGKVQAGKGAIGLVVEHAARRITLPLINVIRVPLIGTQYQLIAPEDIEKMINDSVESLIEIHDGLGYVADHRTAPLAGGSPRGHPAKFDQELEECIAPLPTTPAKEISTRPFFDLHAYRRHLLDRVQGCVVQFDGFSALVHDAYLDRVYRFITAVFLDDDGLLDIEQQHDGTITLVGA